MESSRVSNAFKSGLILWWWRATGERARYASRATPSEDSDEREGAVEETAARVPAAQPADDAVIPSDTPAPPALAGAAAGDDASGG